MSVMPLSQRHIETVCSSIWFEKIVRGRKFEDLCKAIYELNCSTYYDSYKDVERKDPLILNWQRVRCEYKPRELLKMVDCILYNTKRVICFHTYDLVRSMKDECIRLILNENDLYENAPYHIEDYEVLK